MKRDAKGKRPSFYEEPALDQLMSMVMVLAGEVSVLADHMDSMERVMIAKGIDMPKEIATLSLDQQALEQREARRQAMLDRLFYLIRKEAAEAEKRETSSGYTAVLDEIAQA